LSSGTEPTEATGRSAIDAIEEIRVGALGALADAANDAALEEWRVRFLGRRSGLTGLLRGISSLAAEDRPAAGAGANALRIELEEALSLRKRDVRSSGGPDDTLDVTLPGRRRRRGGLHPTTRTIREIVAAFGAMGFQAVEGPEIETERYNFDALNIPADHPARDMWDTLWVEPPEGGERARMLLRTHTSPMQARIMEQREPPIRVVVPGRCFRYEATDATHEWHFFQVEGLAVDEGITFAGMKGTLYEFARRIFGPERKVRFRVDYFPFVEPGAEMAIDCFKCDGAGCSLCKGSGWIEIMGAGMVHPNVLRNVGYDPERYTGFAFGMGVERIGMLCHGIDDIRQFAGGDLRFLSQF
jgi:phenylalanyl-tRNA synthetase alpha chain